MRSKQTGQVGSSIREGVGGAIGLVEREVEGCKVLVVDGMGEFLLIDGVKGSFVMSGNDASWPGRSCVLNSIDLTKTTWQFSGCI